MTRKQRGEDQELCPTNAPEGSLGGGLRMEVGCVGGEGGVGKRWPKAFVGGRQEGPHLGIGRSQEPGNSASGKDQVSNSSVTNSEIGTRRHRKPEEGEIPR